MDLYRLPNEVLLVIVAKIPMLFCCAFVVACAPELIARGMVEPISHAELRAMRQLAYHGQQPRLGRRPSAGVNDYFQTLPTELWMIVGNYLKTEDKLNFAAAIWQTFAREWGVEGRQRANNVDATTVPNNGSL
jgi:hypothetical protein